MKRTLLFCVISAVALCGQDLQSLSDQLQSAIHSGDWKQAAQLSAALKEAAAHARDQSFAGTNRERAIQILGWLPVDTETILVGQVPFQLLEQKPHVRADALTTARGYLLEPLAATEEGAFLKKIEGRTIRFSLMAARRFQYHEEDESGTLPLGMVAYQGCGFYEFTSPVDKAIFGPSEPIMLLGHTTWLAQGKDYDQARDAKQTFDTYYSSLLNPALLMACNDREFYSTVLSRMGKATSIRALPESLPEWKQVDQAAPFWAIRHFNPARARIDPTLSMLGEGDPGAVGMASQIGSPLNTIQARWLSESSKNPWQDISADPDFEGAETKKTSGGVWQLTISVNKPNYGNVIFAVMASLGFAVLL